MRGRRGGRQVEVDAAGQVVRVLKTVDAQPGKNIFLTLDAELQTVAQAQLEGKAGAVVGVDPNTGEVLCMASSPTFDQNVFITGVSQEVWQKLAGDPYRPFENKAVQAEYPPASTFKIVTAIAGLEEGVIDATTTFDCPGYLYFGNRSFRCWRRAGHDTVNVVKALTESCDVFFYHVGIELGIDRLAWYAKACGLGSPTGVGLYPEGRGLIPTAAWKKKRIGVGWQRGETLSVAIGQGYDLTTPLQLAMLVAAVANGGTRLRPTLVKSIKSTDGDIVTQAEPEAVGQLPVSPENLALVRQGLWNVVNHHKGTAYKSRIEGVEMCGKTGTAQVVGRKPGVTLSEEELAEHLKPHAWFVGYAPAVDPKIAVAVIIENGEHGSSAAAPVVSAVIRHYLLGPEPEPEEATGAVAETEGEGAPKPRG
jgi:penicillin-binding protein 2